jgi:Holliday junction resolvase RusA-like endonuclease
MLPIPLFSLMVDHEPVGKQRPRVRKGGRGVYTPDKTRKYEQFIQILSRKEMKHGVPLVGPLIVYAVFTFALPKSKKRRAEIEKEGFLHQQKPDIDNLQKSLLDGLELGGVFQSDKQISMISCVKMYDNFPSVRVTIYSKAHIPSYGYPLNKNLYSFFTKEELPDVCQTCGKKF